MKKEYNNFYDGSFYEMFEGNLFDVRAAEIDELRMKKSDNPVVGKRYLINNGATVEFLCEGSYVPVERSPLKSNDDVLDLTDRQLVLFWKLKVNCKNGTYHGV